MVKRCKTQYCTGTPTHRHRYCPKCQSRRWRSANVLKAVYLTFKSNARRRGIPVEITIEEFEIWCGVYGYLALRGVDAGSMTIDRIYDYDENGNKAAYTYANMVMRTKAFNSAKPTTYMKYKKKETDPF